MVVDEDRGAVGGGGQLERQVAGGLDDATMARHGHTVRKRGRWQAERGGQGERGGGEVELAGHGAFLCRLSRRARFRRRCVGLLAGCTGSNDQ